MNAEQTARPDPSAADRPGATERPGATVRPGTTEGDVPPAGRFPLPAALRAHLPFFALALVWVVTGGLVAAATGPLELAHGSWSAAFQVLVGGVMQGVLATGQLVLAARAPGRVVRAVQLLTWNFGSLAVIGGTLAAAPLLVDAGGAALVVTMALMIGAVGRGARGPVWVLWLFRAALAVTVLSIPVGLLLAHLRA